jgi:erythromycin esterase-like protein
VIASTEWGRNEETMNVPPAQTGSWEYLMHQVKAMNQYLIFNDQNRDEFSVMIGHRAIGVVYHPEYEQFGNYVPSNMGNRYDGFIFVDRTNALHPLVLEHSIV